MLRRLELYYLGGIVCGIQSLLIAIVYSMGWYVAVICCLKALFQSSKVASQLLFRARSGPGLLKGTTVSMLVWGELHLIRSFGNVSFNI